VQAPSQNSDDTGPGLDGNKSRAANFDRNDPSPAGEDLGIQPLETRLNEKTDILPAVNEQTRQWKQNYSPTRHPAWLPAPTTVDHGPPNMPVNRLVLVAKMTVIFLVVLAAASALLFLIKSI